MVAVEGTIEVRGHQAQDRGNVFHTLWLHTDITKARGNATSPPTMPGDEDDPSGIRVCSFNRLASFLGCLKCSKAINPKQGKRNSVVLCISVQVWASTFERCGIYCTPTNAVSYLSLCCPRPLRSLLTSDVRGYGNGHLCGIAQEN